MNKRNFDNHTVASFGDEWNRHHQSDLDQAELEPTLNEYFHLIPWERLPQDVAALLMGTGRWARLIAKIWLHPIAMLRKAWRTDIPFSNRAPFWCTAGIKGAN